MEDLPAQCLTTCELQTGGAECTVLTGQGMCPYTAATEARAKIESVPGACTRESGAGTCEYAAATTASNIFTGTGVLETIIALLILLVKLRRTMRGQTATSSELETGLELQPHTEPEPEPEPDPNTPESTAHITNVQKVLVVGVAGVACQLTCWWWNILSFAIPVYLACASTFPARHKSITNVLRTCVGAQMSFSCTRP